MISLTSLDPETSTPLISGIKTLLSKSVMFDAASPYTVIQFSKNPPIYRLPSTTSVSPSSEAESKFWLDQ
jgi:hypothetical protein